MTLSARSLDASTDPSLGAFTDGQNQAILATGLACSCVSLTATLVTLRWFFLMKRLFRHQLVMFLILSDFFKAFWYFVSPIVIFTRGQVNSSSAWCQASGFFLALAVEASDFAILLIALHAMLYIFRPPVRIGKGGLYQYRKWIPLIWLGPPTIFASLAFINHHQGYVTAGTFCYLPKRPIWYRLALAYIPRYIILITIFSMYAAISIYVHVKFRGFKAVVADNSESNGETDFDRTNSISESIAPHEIVSPERAASPSPPSSPPHLSSGVEKKSNALRPHVPKNFPHRTAPSGATPAQHQEPWDAMNFITSKNLHDHGAGRMTVHASDFVHPARGSASSEETKVASNDPSPYLPGTGGETFKPRQVSEALTANTLATEDTSSPTSKPLKRKSRDLTDPLQRTRTAIRQQLRFLFIYPAVYALMWAFPFAQNCTLYSDYFAAHPLFWLQIVATAALSLQAAVDCLVFSWREKPWRRVNQDSKFSVPFWRQQSAIFVHSLTGSGLFSSRNMSRKGTMTNEEVMHVGPTAPAPVSAPNWWEAEGKKRKDSVWLGTDSHARLTDRHLENDLRFEKLDTIEERAGSA